MGKIIRFILVVSAVLFLAPWLTSLAYGDVNGEPGQTGIRVEAAEAPATPSITIFDHTTGGVTPGDLFYIDASDSAQDLLVNLYITNAHELTPCLRYLILKVAVYYEDKDGRWIKTALQDGNPADDTYITLRNSPVNLYLPGLARYKIAIDSGCFHCIRANKSSDDLSPQFYLTVDSA